MPKHKFNFKAGDRVAYSAAFLKNTGQFAGYAPQRRGTFASYYEGSPAHAYVHWDDEAERIAAGQGDFAEMDYCEHVKAHGSLVALSAIAKVGSARYALNDL